MHRMKWARSLWPCCPICQSRVSAICLSPVSSVPIVGDSQLGPGVPPHSTPPSFNHLVLTSLPSTSCMDRPLTILSAFYIYFLLSVFSVCAILWGWDRGEGAGHVEMTSVYVPRPASSAPAPLPPCPVCDSSHHLPLPSTLPFRSRPHPNPPLCVLEEPLPCVLCPVCARGHTAPHVVLRASKRPTCPPCPFLAGLFLQFNQ